MKSIRILASAIALLSIVGAADVAQGAGVKKACAADRQRLCPGLTDRHAARQCMKSHKADVSPDCQSAMAAAKAARAQRKAAAAAAGPAAAVPPAGEAPGPSYAPPAADGPPPASAAAPH